MAFEDKEKSRKILSFHHCSILLISHCSSMVGEGEDGLQGYKAQKSAIFSYSSLRRITSGFKEKMWEGAHIIVYKGKSWKTRWDIPFNSIPPANC